MPLFSSLSGLLKLTVPFSEDLAVSALHLVLWRDIPDGAVQAIEVAVGPDRIVLPVPVLDHYFG
jgi:hypothetical protein